MKMVWVLFVNMYTCRVAALNGNDDQYCRTLEQRMSLNRLRCPNFTAWWNNLACHFRIACSNPAWEGIGLMTSFFFFLVFNGEPFTPMNWASLSYVKLLQQSVIATWDTLLQIVRRKAGCIRCGQTLSSSLNLHNILEHSTPRFWRRSIPEPQSHHPYQASRVEYCLAFRAKGWRPPLWLKVMDVL